MEQPTYSIVYRCTYTPSVQFRCMYTREDAREHAGLLLASPPHVFRKPPPPGIARATNQRYTAVQHGSARHQLLKWRFLILISSLCLDLRCRDFDLFLNRIFRGFYRTRVVMVVTFGMENEGGRMKRRNFERLKGLFVILV